MKFAELENSPAEERAILAEIISTFGAVELKPPGIERARQLADQCESLGATAGVAQQGRAPLAGMAEVAGSTPVPGSAPENLPLWEEAA